MYFLPSVAKRVKIGPRFVVTKSAILGRFWPIFGPIFAGFCQIFYDLNYIKNSVLWQWRLENLCLQLKAVNDRFLSPFRLTRRRLGTLFFMFFIQ